LISVVIIAVVVNYGMRLMVDVRTEVNKTLELPLDTSEDIARLVAGRVGRITSISAITLTQVGIGCAYVLFVANQLFSILPQLNVQEWALCISPVFGMYLVVCFGSLVC
jgi:amino acid permease